jgi:hypothetical protein
MRNPLADAQAEDGPNAVDRNLDAQTGRSDRAESGVRCQASDPFISHEIDDEFALDKNQFGGLTLSADGLEAFFSANAIGDPETLYRATRKHVSDRFGSIGMVLIDKKAPFVGGDPALSPDGLSLFYTFTVHIDSNGDRATDIYLAKRKALDDALEGGAIVDGVSAPDRSEGDAFVSRDGKTLYFSSNGPGDYDLYYVPTDQLGLHVDPIPLRELNSTTANEFAPVLSPDNLTIYFSSDRNHDFNLVDVWYATRRYEGDGFGGAHHVDELQSTNREYPEAMSDDGCTLWYSSGYKGNGSLYVAKKMPLP